MDNFTTYAELIENVFTNMVKIKLPEFELDEHLGDVANNWAGVIERDYLKEHPGADLDGDYFAEYESEYIYDVLDHYVSYVVSSDFYDLGKLVAYRVPVFWSDELESYVFLQGWFGLSASLVDLPVTIERKKLY